MATPAHEFRQRLAGVRRVVSLDRTCDGRIPGAPKPQKRKLVDELRAACLILPVAYFEDYLRALLDCFVDRLCSYSPRVPWGRLPDRLRWALVYDSIQVMANQRRDRDLATAEARIYPLFEQLGALAAAPHAYVIPAEVLRLTRSNPNGDTVSDLMRLIGIGGLFTQVAAVLPGIVPVTYAPLYTNRSAYRDPAAIKRKLDDIVEARNRAAHGDHAPSKTRDEIAEQIDFLDVLADALQRVVQDHRKQLGSRR